MTYTAYDDTDMSVMFKSLRGIKVPTATEERVLLIRAHRGDRKAKQELTWRNMPLVIKEASRMVRRHNSMSSDKMDILTSALSEGCMALYRAIDAFDVERGTKFSTYAMWHIKEGIRRALVFDKNSVKPVRTLERSRDVDIAITMISFIENFDQEDTTEDDTPEEELHKKLVIREMLKAVDTILSSKEAYIIKNRYGFHGSELTYNDMANMLGISTERVRQIENSALRRIWAYLRKNELLRLDEESTAITDGALLDLLNRR